MEHTSTHQSLYRIYRPETFDDIVGQPELVQALKEQLASGTVSHAYLFAGSRGLGKTSIARIFAKELKTQGSDLYEIDAASNNSVEDIRSLTENVYTLPFQSPYKVYILDEAHMLSKSAWNAFLKTLEEPPAHAIFILATTELEKVPETVQSRCQVYQLRKPTRPLLQKMIIDVAKKEGKKIDAGAADLIAMLARGSYRDALSALQKVISSVPRTDISRSEAEKATGAPASELIHRLIRGISEGSLSTALEVLQKVEMQNIDAEIYLDMVLEDIRNILLVRHAAEIRESIKNEIGDEHYTELEQLAQVPDSRITHATLRVFLDALERLRYSPVPVLPLELALYELLGEK